MNAGPLIPLILAGFLPLAAEGGQQTSEAVQPHSEQATTAPSEGRQSPAAQPTPQGPTCIDTEKIKDYQIETDRIIRLFMASGPDIMMTVKGYCPQLKYHQYFSYTPTNGQICVNIHKITTRSGTSCKIQSFKKLPQAPAKEPESHSPVPG